MQIGTPVVVMEGTGRVADLLAYAWRLLHGTGPEAASYTHSQLYANVFRVAPK